LVSEFQVTFLREQYFDDYHLEGGIHLTVTCNPFQEPKQELLQGRQISVQLLWCKDSLGPFELSVARKYVGVL
jgi:hypothetical protein